MARFAGCPVIMARVAIIGAGPRGLSVLERLLANLQEPAYDALLAGGVDIVLVDPHWPGPGQVWRRDQSELVLMNTPAGACTIFTDHSVKIDGPILPGPTLAEWSRVIAPGLSALPDKIRQVASNLADDSFAPRVLYGYYLHWAFEEVIARAPNGVSVRYRKAEVIDLALTNAVWHVALSDNTTLHDVTSLILTLGHPLAKPQAPRQAGSGHHIGPGNAVDADLATIRAGESVALRGLGLCAFDYIALLTEGRGGQFVLQSDGRYTYAPSGHEPRLILGSRRGLPYRGRGPQPRERYQPRIITPAVVEQLSCLTDLDFETHLWPLIAEELVAALGDDTLTVADLSGGALDGASLLERCSNPLGNRVFADHAALREAIVAHLRADLADGQDMASPFRRIQGALRLARSTIREQISLRRVSPRTHGAALDHIREMIDFSISGPPAHRIAQLLALEAAGIVEFAGPEMTITPDGDGFEISSPRVVTYRRRAEVLIDAFLPPIELEAGGLIARQVQRGLFSYVSPLTGGAALAIDPETLAVLDPQGRPIGSCHTLGLTIAPQDWVPVIAPLAGSNSRFLRITDRAARAVLTELGRTVQQPVPSTKEHLDYAN